MTWTISCASCPAISAIPSPAISRSSFWSAPRRDGRLRATIGRGRPRPASRWRSAGSARRTAAAFRRLATGMAGGERAGFAAPRRRLQPAPAAPSTVLHLVAIAALALGIGANTAIFSVSTPSSGGRCPTPMPIAPPSIAEQRLRQARWTVLLARQLLDWRQDATSFAAMAAFNDGAVNLTGSGEPERIRTLAVSAGFLDALALPPAIGRSFRLDEES